METGGEEVGERVNVEEMRGENVETGGEETAGRVGEEGRECGDRWRGNGGKSKC